MQKYLSSTWKTETAKNKHLFQSGTSNTAKHLPLLSTGSLGGPPTQKTYLFETSRNLLGLCCRNAVFIGVQHLANFRFQQQSSLAPGRCDDLESLCCLRLWVNIATLSPINHGISEHVPTITKLLTKNLTSVDFWVGFLPVHWATLIQSSRLEPKKLPQVKATSHTHTPTREERPHWRYMWIHSMLPCFGFLLIMYHVLPSEQDTLESRNTHQQNGFDGFSFHPLLLRGALASNESTWINWVCDFLLRGFRQTGPICLARSSKTDTQSRSPRPTRPLQKLHFQLRMVKVASPCASWSCFWNKSVSKSSMNHHSLGWIYMNNMMEQSVILLILGHSCSRDSIPNSFVAPLVWLISSMWPQCSEDTHSKNWIELAKTQSYWFFVFRCTCHPSNQDISRWLKIIENTADLTVNFVLKPNNSGCSFCLRRLELLQQRLGVGGSAFSQRGKGSFIMADSYHLDGFRYT